MQLYVLLCRICIKIIVKITRKFAYRSRAYATVTQDAGIYSVSHVYTCTDNEIDGEAFLDLTEGDVKEIVKPLGQVKKIMRLQTALKVKAKQHDQESPVCTKCIYSECI